jgi:hypothetical protein
MKVLLARAMSYRCDALMAMKITPRLLTAVLVLAVCAFATQGVAHSHGVTHDEDRCTCQVCHIGHAAIPQPTHSTDAHSSPLIDRFVPAEESAVAAEVIATPSIPRAPPA